MGPFNMGLTGQPDLDRDIVEERQREALQQAEADRLAQGDRVEKGDYRPITDGAEDLVDSTDHNPHITRD
ncbi:MAG: hypothetical protein MUF87_03110 [Anaerolineae bacterium]|jgi:hypothetical protein|nr:hypothetical protein [Anaerolineae bacterium]